MAHTVTASDVGLDIDERAVDCSTGALHDALSHRRRRQLLAVLSDRDGEASIGELADEVADRTGASGDSDVRERIEIELYHCHVPKLAEAGLVRFDGESGAVRPARPCRNGARGD